MNKEKSTKFKQEALSTEELKVLFGAMPQFTNDFAFSNGVFTDPDDEDEGG